MAIISVEVPDIIASKFKLKETISIEKLYEVEENNIENLNTIKVGEKASVVLDFLKSIK